MAKKKVLTQAGVERLWAAIEAKFIDINEIEDLLPEVEPGTAMEALTNEEIDAIKKYCTEKSMANIKWPMIIFKSLKGWTCPKEVDGKQIEGTADNKTASDVLYDNITISKEDGLILCSCDFNSDGKDEKLSVDYSDISDNNSAGIGTIEVRNDSNQVKDILEYLDLMRMMK